MKFVHIPKTGGRSVVVALGTLKGHRHKTAAEIRKEFPDCGTWAIIRDPVDRWFSAYRFIYHLRQIRPLKTRRENRCVDSVRAFGRDPNKVATNKADLVNLESLDFVFTKQVSWIGNLGYDADIIFRFGEWSNICDFIGIESLPHENKSIGKLEPLTEESKRAIREHYCEDQELWNVHS